MPANVTSGSGDCFNRIANREGFFNYRSVYDYDDNAASFPNPNQIEEGSTVKVPDKEMRAFTVKLDAESKFKVLRKKISLKLKVCTALTNSAPNISKAELVVGQKKQKTISSGAIDLDNIDPDVAAGMLTLTLSAPPPYQKPPDTPAAVANQYPPKVVHADFEDPATVWPKHGDTVTFTLEIGSLEPKTATRGTLQRLHNLGFRCPVQKTENDDTKRAVRTYRRVVEGLQPPNDTDSAADIANHIQGRHDS